MLELCAVALRRRAGCGWPLCGRACRCGVCARGVSRRISRRYAHCECVWMLRHRSVVRLVRRTVCGARPCAPVRRHGRLGRFYHLFHVQPRNGAAARIGRMGYGGRECGREPGGVHCRRYGGKGDRPCMPWGARLTKTPSRPVAPPAFIEQVFPRNQAAPGGCAPSPWRRFAADACLPCSSLCRAPERYARWFGP